MSVTPEPPTQVEVSVKSTYLDGQSAPEEHRYVFAYTVTITNRGPRAARLVSRHWIITDANNDVREVRGLGVVGEHPHLAPEESFTYTSGAVLETPVGHMQGSYQMVTDDGDQFDAAIPAFNLSIPGALH